MECAVGADEPSDGLCGTLEEEASPRREQSSDGAGELQNGQGSEIEGNELPAATREQQMGIEQRTAAHHGSQDEAPDDNFGAEESKASDLQSPIPMGEGSQGSVACSEGIGREDSKAAVGQADAESAEEVAEGTPPSEGGFAEFSEAGELREERQGKAPPSCRSSSPEGDDAGKSEDEDDDWGNDDFQEAGRISNTSAVEQIAKSHPVGQQKTTCERQARSASLVRAASGESVDEDTHQREGFGNHSAANRMTSEPEETDVTESDAWDVPEELQKARESCLHVSSPAMNLSRHRQSRSQWRFCST